MKPDRTKLIERFNGKKICVIGDIIADIFIFGESQRLSREAPVVVVKHEEERYTLAAQATRSTTLLALGAHVFPLGFIGSDSAGDRLVDFFPVLKRIEIDGFIRHDGETQS